MCGFHEVHVVEVVEVGEAKVVSYPVNRLLSIIYPYKRTLMCSIMLYLILHNVFLHIGI